MLHDGPLQEQGGEAADLNENAAMNLGLQSHIVTLHMIDTLECAKVPAAWSLTDLDLATVALNALYEGANYFLPPPPIQAYQSVLPQVKQAVHENLISPEALIADIQPGTLQLFLHTVHAAVIRGIIPLADQAAALQTGFVTLGEDVYPDFLDVLQNSARAMHADPEAYRADAVMLLSTLASLAVNIHGNSPVGAVRPMIDIQAACGSHLTYQTIQGLMTQFLPRGGRVLIPGAGYNSLTNLNTMKAANTLHFILNDQDPLVTPVLQRVVDDSGAPNLSVVPGDFGRMVVEERSLDFAILSQLHVASPESAKSLVAILEKGLKPGSMVALTQPVSTGRTGETILPMWLEYLKAHSFKIEIDYTELLEYRALLPEADQETSRELKSADIMNLFETAHSRPRGTVYQGFIMAQRVS